MLKEVILPLTGLEWLGELAKGIKGTIGVKILLISSALSKQLVMQYKVVLKLVILPLKMPSWAPRFLIF